MLILQSMFLNFGHSVPWTVDLVLISLIQSQRSFSSHCRQICEKHKIYLLPRKTLQNVDSWEQYSLGNPLSWGAHRVSIQCHMSVVCEKKKHLTQKKLNATKNWKVLSEESWKIPSVTKKLWLHGITQHLMCFNCVSMIIDWNIHISIDTAKGHSEL